MRQNTEPVAHPGNKAVGAEAVKAGRGGDRIRGSTCRVALRSERGSPAVHPRPHAPHVSITGKAVSQCEVACIIEIS